MAQVELPPTLMVQGEVPSDIASRTWPVTRDASLTVQATEALMPSKPTGRSNHGDRRYQDATERQMLDELDSLVDRRERAMGQVGDLQGKMVAAVREYVERLRQAVLLETRAAAVRAAYETLHAAPRVQGGHEVVYEDNAAGEAAPGAPEGLPPGSVPERFQPGHVNHHD